MTREHFNKRLRVVLACAAALNRNIKQEEGPLSRESPLEDKLCLYTTWLAYHAERTDRVTAYEAKMLVDLENEFNTRIITKRNGYKISVLEAVRKDLRGVEARNRDYSIDLIYGLEENSRC